jgi:5-methylcytosine-specific restriction endonuclease McrA
MNEDILLAASRLSDDALDTRLKALAVRDRGTTVEIVGLLAELLGRKKHLGEGWGSVYTWCRDTLRMSEDAAYNRVAAARAVRRFPVVLGHLAAGFVNVTTVRVLRPVLTAKNHVAVLNEARHCSTRAAKLIAARLDPKPDVPSTIRKLPAPTPAPVALMFSSAAPEAPPRVVSAAPAPCPPPVIAPLTPERYRLQFTVSKETHDKLRRVQDLLCREVRDGDPAAIFDRALDVLLREVEKTKRAATSAPRRPRGTKEGSRHIPAGVSRAVWKRDGQRCAFAGSGGRCQETRFLELHHIHPYGHQGPATVENISVRCRAHNVYDSELVFGPFVVRETRENYADSGETRAVSKRKKTKAILSASACSPDPGESGPGARP